MTQGDKVINIVPHQDPLVPQANRYTQEMVDKCYQVWAYIARRSPSRVRKLLEDQTWRESVGLVWDEPIPHYDTIRDWSTNYNWLERFHNEIEETGGALIYQAKAEMLLGVGEAIGLLRDTVNDDTQKRSDQIKAAELLINNSIGRDSANAAQSKPRGESDIDIAQLKHRSTEELLALARSLSDKRSRRTDR